MNCECLFIVHYISSIYSVTLLSSRCALAPHLGPAAWPDTNRYQEAFISRLCLALPSSTSKDGKRLPRWKGVMDAYNRVRDMLFNNGKILTHTNMQLPDVNQKTLTAWYVHLMCY